MPANEAGECTVASHAVDATYQTQLKETNELNWGRFKAHLDAGLAGLRSDLMRWMFVYWVGSVVTLGGLIIGMLRFGAR